MVDRYTNVKICRKVMYNNQIGTVDVYKYSSKGDRCMQIYVEKIGKSSNQVDGAYSASRAQVGTAIKLEING